MLEHELKIPVADLDQVRVRLVEAGAECLRQAVRESNVLYDYPDQRFKTSDRALRLRRVAESSILTFKGPSTYSGNIKQREELEVEVDSDLTLAAILERLGLRPLIRYEKDRELWHLGGVEVALDHTPMGDFVELEGPPGSLDAAATSLELSPERAVRGSYLTLWQSFRERHGEDELPVDMVFSP